MIRLSNEGRPVVPSDSYWIVGEGILWGASGREPQAPEEFAWKGAVDVARALKLAAGVSEEWTHHRETARCQVRCDYQKEGLSVSSPASEAAQVIIAQRTMGESCVIDYINEHDCDADPDLVHGLLEAGEVTLHPLATSLALSGLQSLTRRGHEPILRSIRDEWRFMRKQPLLNPFDQYPQRRIRGAARRALRELVPIVDTTIDPSG